MEPTTEQPPMATAASPEPCDLETEASHPHAAEAVEASGIRPVDHLVLELLRRQEGLTVHDLIAKLEVTQTAVRIRLDRLEAMGLLERRKAAAGRGRPVYRYFLTQAGWREVGVTYTDLALAFWEEIGSLADRELRQRLVDGAARRMGQAYAQQLSGASVEERLLAMAKLLSDRKIPTKVERGERLPVLTVEACPFPGMIDADHRLACELEEQVLSRALGSKLELSCCRLDGHGSCQFRPVENTATAVP